MPKIARVTIKGFQSHVDSSFFLSPGLSVITGPSDAGKTSIIRAVKWVAYGEPSGEAFVNEAVGESIVEIEMDSGVIVIKSRKKGKTRYEVSTLPEPFEKAEVPLEVTEALGISKQNFSEFETALNFAFQLEAPFLISEAPSVGAKVLGKLAGTEIVDLATKAVAKDTYAARQIKSAALKEIEDREAQLLNYTDIEQLQEQIEACEFIVKDIDALLLKQQNLESLGSRLKNMDLVLVSCREKLDRFAVVPELQTELNEIEKAQQRYDRLLDLFNRFTQVTNQIETLSNQLQALEGIKDLPTRLDRLAIDHKRMDTLQDLSQRYQKRQEEVNRANLVLERTKAIEPLPAMLDSIVLSNTRLTVLQQLKIQFQAAFDKADRFEKAVKQTATISDIPEMLRQIGLMEDRKAKLIHMRAAYNTKDVTQQAAQQRIDQAVQLKQIADSLLSELWNGLDECPLCNQVIAHTH